MKSSLDKLQTEMDSSQSQLGEKEKHLTESLSQVGTYLAG